MELDNKNLGRLRRVADPRSVWESESVDFTPWLADNIDVLAEELGMALTVVATEVYIGQFKLDIHAEDEDGRVVVIENQLERTDHSHLGQSIVYAAGLEASTVIWVSRQFRDEFRRAFDWLNERTDTGVQFFGVEIGVVQIGETGPRAPVFDVVSRPNDWQKDVKSHGGGASSSTVPSSPLNEARQDLFATVLETVNSQRASLRVPSRNSGSWISFASGPFGYWSLAQVGDGRLRVEAYLDCGDRARNKALFDEFTAQRSQWDERTGLELEYERLDDKRASRICVYHPAVDLLETDDDEVPADVADWMARTLLAMIDALNEPLRTRAKQLRTIAALPSGGLPSE